MKTLAVLETRREDLARRLSALTARGGARVLGAYRAQTLAGLAPEILLVSPGYSERGAAGRELTCGTLLLPGWAETPDFAAKSVVTYGMSPRDTLTLSSIGAPRGVVSLQREVMTADGELLDMQELIIRGDAGADELLAVTGGLLLLGLTPGEWTYTTS
ncbi:MAG: hypothetical protein LBT12_06105 [Oscillospiraceae bacterium]|jgi:hypothetical protein|nr:hypothetical protein [Oscillospiraceae bacterium]